MRKIVLVALLAFVAGAGTYRLAAKTIYTLSVMRAANPYYEVRREQFAIAKPPSNPVVMLGDSITEQGLWPELTGCPNIINRGISSDTTAGVLNRIDEIVALKPKRVYLMIGVNDVIKRQDLSNSAENIRSTIRILKEHDIDTVRFSTLPVAGEFASLNEPISELNGMNKDAVPVDIQSSDLSYDGIHLRASGYQKIASKISC